MTLVSANLKIAQSAVIASWVVRLIAGVSLAIFVQHGPVFLVVPAHPPPPLFRHILHVELWLRGGHLEPQAYTPLHLFYDGIFYC